MKNIIKKINFIIMCSLVLSTISVQSFFNNGGPNNAFTGAAIGGLAGGRKGAAIGLGVGAFTDMVGAAAARDDYRYRRGYDDDRRSYNEGYRQGKRRAAREDERRRNKKAIQEDNYEEEEEYQE